MGGRLRALPGLFGHRPGPTQALVHLQGLRLGPVSVLVCASPPSPAEGNLSARGLWFSQHKKRKWGMMPFITKRTLPLALTPFVRL